MVGFDPKRLLNSQVRGEKEEGRDEMVRVSREVLEKAGSRLGSLAKTLSEVLVCPISKQPLRYCEQSNSLISDAVGVSFPIKDGIPCLVPKDGKILEEEDASKPNNDTILSAVNKENRGSRF